MVEFKEMSPSKVYPKAQIGYFTEIATKLRNGGAYRVIAFVLPSQMDWIYATLPPGLQSVNYIYHRLYEAKWNKVRLDIREPDMELLNSTYVPFPRQNIVCGQTNPLDLNNKDNHQSEKPCAMRNLIAYIEKKCQKDIIKDGRLWWNEHILSNIHDENSEKENSFFKLRTMVNAQQQSKDYTKYEEKLKSNHTTIFSNCLNIKKPDNRNTHTSKWKPVPQLEPFYQIPKQDLKGNILTKELCKYKSKDGNKDGTSKDAQNDENKKDGACQETSNAQNKDYDGACKDSSNVENNDRPCKDTFNFKAKDSVCKEENKNDAYQFISIDENVASEDISIDKNKDITYEDRYIDKNKYVTCEDISMDKNKDITCGFIDKNKDDVAFEDVSNNENIYISLKVDNISDNVAPLNQNQTKLMNSKTINSTEHSAASGFTVKADIKSTINNCNVVENVCDNCIHPKQTLHQQLLNSQFKTKVQNSMENNISTAQIDKTIQLNISTTESDTNLETPPHPLSNLTKKESHTHYKHMCLFHPRLKLLNERINTKTQSSSTNLLHNEEREQGKSVNLTTNEHMQGPPNSTFSELEVTTSLHQTHESSHESMPPPHNSVIRSPREGDSEKKEEKEGKKKKMKTSIHSFDVNMGNTQNRKQKKNSIDDSLKSHLKNKNGDQKNIPGKTYF